MNLYELIGRSVTIAALALFLLTLYDMAQQVEPRAWQAVQAFFDVIDGAIR